MCMHNLLDSTVCKHTCFMFPALFLGGKGVVRAPKKKVI